MSKQLFSTFLGLFAFILLYPLKADATYKGTITLTVGQSYYVDPGFSYTATVSGDWTKTGSGFVITSQARNQSHCTIQAIHPGTGTLKFWGFVNADKFELEWDVVVKAPGGDMSEPDIEEPTELWLSNGNYSISWYNKSQMEFAISSNKDLAGLAYLVNSGEDDFEEKTIYIASDIDLSGKKWTPIGFEKESFRGNFNGMGHSIKGIYIGGTTILDANHYGFFGKVVGNIENTSFEGIVNVNMSQEFCYVGGIAGWLYGNLDNCKCEMPVYIKLENSDNATDGPVSVGGCVGDIYGSVYNCLHRGSIFVDTKRTVNGGYYIGGVVGRIDNTESIAFCENYSAQISCTIHDDMLGWIREIQHGIGGLVGTSFGGSYSDPTGTPYIKCCKSVIGTISIIAVNYQVSAKYNFNISGICGYVQGGQEDEFFKNNFCSVTNITGYANGYFPTGGSRQNEYFNVKHNGSSCYVNSDLSTDYTGKVYMNKGGNANNSFSSSQMQTDSFLDALNKDASSLNLGTDIWTHYSGDYPGIAKFFETPESFVTVTSIALNKSVMTLKVGERKQLVPVLAPENASIKSVIWQSDDESVVTINNVGRLTAIAAGTAVITCKANDGSGKQTACNVIVEARSPQDSILYVWAGKGNHTMILKTDNSLWACGKNTYGQLCDGTTTNRTTPIQVMTNVDDVAAGDNYTMILKTDGTLWGCGRNSKGQLANYNYEDKAEPEQIKARWGDNYTTDIAGVWAGNEHTMILKNNGVLWACGNYTYGQLGNGENAGITAFPIKIMSGVIQVSTGGNHTMILKYDGTLWACGRNDHGQLGDGTTTSRSTPVQIMTNVAQVASGNSHTMILKTDGTLWGCGDNSHGQLGDGTTEDKHAPVKVLEDVALVDAGGYHTVFLMNNGNMRGCGWNTFGQIGTGDTNDRHIPQLIMTDVAHVSAGYGHTMFLKTDGSLWACGNNEHGQLGDGSTVDRRTPVMISKGEDIIPEEELKGDVNGDGEVNGTDLVALTNIILGKSEKKSAADMNGDGEVNGTDYVTLANIVLGKK